MTKAVPTCAAGAKPDDSAILRETLHEIWRAWWHTRFLRRPVVGALLPPVPSSVANDCDPENLWKRVDRIVRRAMFWKGDKYCFYRSFAVASMLRRRGVSARLDFGLRLARGRRRQCHCWVSIHGRPLGEATDPNRNFPVAAGGRGEEVHYWLADEDSGD